MLVPVPWRTITPRKIILALTLETFVGEINMAFKIMKYKFLV